MSGQRWGKTTNLSEKLPTRKPGGSGTAASKSEKAQLLVVKAPDVVASIMMDGNANARHRIDSAKVLNDFAANPQEGAAAASEMFSITINLGSDTDGKPVIEHYNKSIEVDPHNGEPVNGSLTPQRPLPDKRWDDDALDDVVAAPSERSVKPIERKAGRLVERKSPKDGTRKAPMRFE